MRSIIALLFGSFLLQACGDGAQPSPAVAVAGGDTLAAFILNPGKIEKQTVLPAELLPYERVEIHPKLNGYVRQLKVDIGSVVKKGQVLAIIDAPEIGSQLDQQTGKVKAAEARYRSSRDTYDRILDASKEEGVVAPNELERARNQVIADSADYQATLFSAAAYRQVGNYLVVTAPYRGIITQRNVNEGAYVGNPAEKPLLVLEDESRLRLQVAVPEALSGGQLKADKIRFSTRANPDQSYEGKLVRKSGSIDAATRTEIWEFDVPNEKGTLKSGSFADVRLEWSRAGNSFIVPFSAIVTTQERKFVSRFHAGIVQWVDVSQGINLADRAEIFGSLQAGDTLLLNGNEERKPGSKVVVRVATGTKTK
jgi:membrane fusion protein (multidrug efflux system)